MDSALQEKVDEWLQWDRNEATRSEISSLVEAKDYDTLRKLLCTRLEFGTAGLRAAMGAGYARMNELSVLQTAQGLALYLQETIPSEALLSKGIIIGYDARHNSSRFAEITANVMLSKKIPTKLFRQIVATPYVPFGVTHFGCVAGVMVTASHNPKQDNGYKVYWTNGAQLVPPHDAGIASAILRSLKPEDSSWTHQEGASDPFDEITEHYYSSLKKEIRAPEMKERNLKFVYTAMHGVGTEFTTRSLELFGFGKDHVALVEEQCTPDPEFPTVTFPNPEEGKSSLNLSFKRADETGSRIILANDPDADRLAVAEKVGDSWRIFNGNQIGALLGWWQMYWFKATNGGKIDTSTYMVASAVSSKILASMAAKEGFSFQETLTGFKWMGSRAELLKKEGKNVIFAFEEAIGFMIGDRVYDKDGVTAAGVMAEMATWLAVNEQKTLSEKLLDIYSQYGYHTTYNSYVTSSDTTKTKEMFDSMRELNNGTYPSKIAGANVLSVRDLSVGFDSTTDDKKALLPSSAASPMITFNLDNGVILTIRGSGTEPKIKWYSEIIRDTNPSEQEFTSFVDQAVEELMRPSTFNLKKRQS